MRFTIINILIGFSTLTTFSFGQQTINKSFVHDGITRSYSIYIPASYQASQAVPLLINLHGHGSTGSQQSLYTKFENIADTANFIIVHPDGTTNPTTNQTFWNIGLAGTTVDDASFLSDLVDTISAHYSILQDRIYSAGISNGGYMSYVLACQTTKFRAIASVTGSMTNYMYNNCSSLAGIPIIQIHGTDDTTVAYNGDQNSKSIEDVVSFWVDKNNCNPTPATINIPNTNTSDGSTATRYLYSGGTENHTVEFYKVTGGGHTWPGALNIPTLGNTNQDFSASKEIWRFFNQFQSEEEVGLKKIETQNIVVSPNPSTGIFEISNLIPQTNVQVLNLNGQTVATPIILNNTIDLSLMPKGTYLLEIQTEIQKVVKKIVLN